MALYKQLAPIVEDEYWDHTFEELAEKHGCGVSTIQRAADHAGLPKKTEQNRVEHTHGVEIERLLHHLHHDVLLSVNQISKCLNVSRITLDRWFNDVDVKKRGQSEAEKVKWQKMDEEERQQQVSAAHKASRTTPRFETSARGYERITHCRNEFKVHRLAAVAWFGWDAVEGNHVHHKNAIKWDNRESNIKPMPEAKHLRHHAEEHRCDKTGQFV